MCSSLAPSFACISKGFSIFDSDPGAIPVPISPDYPDYHESGHLYDNHHFLHADSPYKKTDAVTVSEAKANVAKSTTIDDMKLLDLPQDVPVTPKKTEYTYFNVRTAKALEPEVEEQKMDQRRSGGWLHPTTATFKDKRIAGVRASLFE